MGAPTLPDEQENPPSIKGQSSVPVHDDGAPVDSTPQEISTTELEEPLTASNRLLLILISVFIILAVILSPNPFYTLLFVILALVPAFPFARYINKNFRDSAVSRSFLVSQLLIGAIPLLIIVLQIEWILTAIIGYLMFRAEYERVEDAMDNIDIGETQGDDDFTTMLIETMGKTFPVWKIVIFFILTAFFTAGLVEEIGKWVVANRFKRIEPEQPADADAVVPRIGCRGILASFCMTALGFAAAENVGFVLGVAQAYRSKFSFEAVGVVLLRGILAYPVHIGAQFYIGVSSAQRYVFKDPSRVWLAAVVAVLFHGMFDAVSLISLVLITLKKIPAWTGTIVPVFHFILIGLLLLLCRGRHKALLEREKIVLLQPPV